MKSFLKTLLTAFLLTVLTACPGPHTPSPNIPLIKDFDAFFDKLIALEQAISILSWEMETGGAPVGAMEARSKAIAVLDAERFAMLTSDEMRNFFRAVEAAQKKGEADEISLGIYRITKRDHDKLMVIPADEYQAFSGLTAYAFITWGEAREANNYTLFAQTLQQIIDYQRKFVEYRKKAGMVYTNPYDAMLDDFEPGMTVAILDVFFDDLRSNIVPLLNSIKGSSKTIRSDFLERNIPVQIQKDVSQLLVDTVGYDLNRGILGISAHPFTLGIGQSDVRITTHYDEDNLFSSFYSVMHECGHAIYEQNVAKKLEGTILDTGTSMGIHESQSRFLENQIGRSYAFWQGIEDDFRSTTGIHYNGITLDELYEAVNIVTPSLIRIEADELTYSLHIMVRYEIEKMIFNDPNLTAAELPALWNQKMQEYLGVTPQTYSEGILQDIHWSFGEFGYFPTYALGNAYAAQIWNAMEKDFDVNAAIRSLNFTAIKGWLTDKIHKHGALLTPAQVLAQFTNEGFNASYYIDYLKSKYSALYEIQ